MKLLKFLAVLSLGTFIFASSSISGENDKTGASEGTVTGRVVDPACYIGMGLKGESHKECAVKCAKAGQAFGILDEDNGLLYQVLEGSPMADPNQLLWDHAEDVVTIKGMIFEKDGMRAIVPKEVSSGS